MKLTLIQKHLSFTGAAHVISFLLLAILLALSPQRLYAQSGPQISSDKADYAPGETVTLSGSGWQAGETVNIYVNDDSSQSWSHNSNPDAVADSRGEFVYTFQLPSWFVANYSVLAGPGTLGSGSASTTFTDVSVGTYDQCSNDDGDGFATGDTGCRWINGNLQSNNSTYAEGDATVQRLWLTDFLPGTTHTVSFKYGTTKGGDHAYDYLTTWNWSENWITLDDRCQAITGCTTATETTVDIADDPNVPNTIEPTAPGSRQFVMRGGTLNSVTTPVIVSGSYAGDSETVITVNFTVASSGPMCSGGTCSVVLWFGAHVASQIDWGVGNGAGNIPGSPYHVALEAVDGAAVGQRDNQMQGATIIPNGTIVVVKDAVPNSAQDFSFNLTNNTTINEDFSLDDDANATLPSSQTFSVPPGTYTAKELNIPAGWNLTNLVCSDPSGNTTTSLGTATATISLASAETVTCTFTNTQVLPALSLAKTMLSNADEDQSGTVTLNDTLTYQFVATNIGNVTLNNVTIVDPLPGLSALTCNPVQPAVLAVGASLTCTATYVVKQSDVDAGQIFNEATADSNETPEDKDDETVVIPQNPALQLVKSLLSNADQDQSGTVTLNDTLTYQFVATNSGNVTLNNVTIVDPLPGLSALSCNPVQPAVLGVGASLTCTAIYVVNQSDVDAGQIFNEATADSNETPEDKDDETVVIPQNPALQLVKSLWSNADQDQSGTVTLDDTLTYQFVATNIGNIALNNVTIVDPLPGLSALSCNPVQPAVLGVGASLTCTAIYVVNQSDVDAGQIFNEATADSNETPEDKDDETVVIPQNPALQLVKSLLSNADQDQSGGVSLNDTLTYQFVATNIGNVTLNNVTIVDPLPGLSALTCNPVQPAVLAPAASMTCTATYVVKQSDVNAGQVVNEATADSNETPEDKDDETVTIPKTPALTLLKSLLSNADQDQSSSVTVNDTLTYQFVATNIGNVTLNNVTIVDPLPGISALTCNPAQPAVLAVGASLTCTATYVVKQSDVEAGQVFNEATADSNETPAVKDDLTVGIPKNPALSLVKTLLSNADEDQSGTITLNDTLTFQFVATNIGNITLNNVVISDPLPGISALTCNPAQPTVLAVGASLTCTATYVVKQADVSAGKVFNEATVDSSETEEVKDDVTAPVPPVEPPTDPTNLPIGEQPQQQQQRIFMPALHHGG